MELFDNIIIDTSEKIAGIISKRWDFDETDTWKTLGRSELVMQCDQAFELGGSGTPSSNFTCVTTTKDLVSQAPKDRDVIFQYQFPRAHLQGKY